MLKILLFINLVLGNSIRVDLVIKNPNSVNEKDNNLVQTNNLYLSDDLFIEQVE